MPTSFPTLHHRAGCPLPLDLQGKMSSHNNGLSNALPSNSPCRITGNIVGTRFEQRGEVKQYARPHRLQYYWSSASEGALSCNSVYSPLAHLSIEGFHRSHYSLEYTFYLHWHQNSQHRLCFIVLVTTPPP